MISYNEFQLDEHQIDAVKKMHQKLAVMDYIKKNGVEPSNISQYYTATENELELHRRAFYAQYAQNQPYDPYNGHEYVDLGLPSGLKWATCNVGASTPTEYGDYFMWGSTTPNTNDNCAWENAPFNNGSSSWDISYFYSVKNTVCPDGVLALEYDGVRAIMGGEWRMPVIGEINELLNNTDQEWVYDYQGSGINGGLFTSKVDSDKSIFIPASGGRFKSSNNSKGYNTRLWSSSIGSNSKDTAWSLHAYSDKFDFNENEVRYIGLPLRGVIA